MDTPCSAGNPMYRSKATQRLVERVSAGRRECGAKCRDGRPCSTPPMSNGRCRMHGGASLAGVRSPRFKHGRYSRDPIAREVGKHTAPQAWEAEREKERRRELRAMRKRAHVLAAKLNGQGRHASAAM